MVKEVPVWSVLDGHLNYLVEQQKMYLEIVKRLHYGYICSRSVNTTVYKTECKQII